MSKEKNNNTTDDSSLIIEWRVPEFETHQRTKKWYFYAILISAILLLFAFLSGNYLFAIFIILSAIIIVLHDKQEPIPVYFAITTTGIIIGKKRYDYSELKNFSIVFKPHLNKKNLYFEFKSATKMRLSIPLMDMDPLLIRKNLLKFLPEDLDRTDEPLSESLSRLLKI